MIDIEFEQMRAEELNKYLVELEIAWSKARPADTKVACDEALTLSRKFCLDAREVLRPAGFLWSRMRKQSIQHHTRMVRILGCANLEMAA